MSNLVQSDIQACNTNCQGISSVFLKERGCLMVNQVPWSVSRVWFNVCISRGWSGLRLLWPWILGYYDPGYEERSAWECGDSKESFWTKIIHEVSEVSLEKQNIQPKNLVGKRSFSKCKGNKRQMEISCPYICGYDTWVTYTHRLYASILASSWNVIHGISRSNA